MKFYISGEWVDRNEKINVTNPFDGTIIDTVPKGNVQDVENAINSSVNGAKVMENIWKLKTKSGSLRTNSWKMFGSLQKIVENLWKPKKINGKYFAKNGSSIC